MEKLLEIKNLSVDLMSVRGIVYALDGVCLDIMPGEIHGLVGESGCGKSMTSKSIMRLHNPARSRVRGEILFEGRDLLKLSKKRNEQDPGTGYFHDLSGSDDFPKSPDDRWTAD